jgi:phosphatidylinositol glycan class A protein
MINSPNLVHKVTLLGGLHHNEVRKVMIMGDIYLNTSLTEAFCIANVEAASCGLHVISTDIGGVAEVLPDEMCKLVRPYKKDIIKGVSDIIRNIEKIRIKKEISNYDLLNNTYNGDKVARKTVNFFYLIFYLQIKVYEKALRLRDVSILNRFKKCFSIGNISGLFYLSLIILDYLLLMIIIFVFRKKDIKKQKNLNYKKLKEILKNK